MGILDRLSTVIKANVNDLVSKAEDPEKVLNQAIEDMQSELKKAKQQIIESLAMQKQLESKLNSSRLEVQSLESKAMQALSAGNEDLARQALIQKNKLDGEIAEFETSVKTQSEYVGALKGSLAMLEGKIDEAKAHRDQLIHRLKKAKIAQQRAKTSQTAAAAAGMARDSVNETSAFDNFDRMVDKIEMLEAHVEAQRELMGDELNADKSAQDLEALSVEEQLRALKEKQANPVEDQLAALKRKLQEG